MNKYLKNRDNYIQSKFGGISFSGADDEVSLQILSYLDRLGFPMYDKWVYVYHNLIMEVVYKLNMILYNEDISFDDSCSELISNLRNSDNYMYRGIALDLGISLDELIAHFDMVISRIDSDKMDNSLLESICEEYSYELNYGELAFILASMVLGYKKEKRDNKIKIRGL